LCGNIPDEEPAGFGYVKNFSFSTLQQAIGNKPAKQRFGQNSAFFTFLF
jgi:hypothetical protein